MRLLLSAAIAAATFSVSFAGAEARVRRTHVVHQARLQPPVIRGRSFLDSGKVVPVGSLSNYVTQSTTFNTPIYRTFAPDSFGQSVLPTRFNNPGRQQPVAEFYTPVF